jgi:hypothetical protein
VLYGVNHFRDLSNDVNEDVKDRRVQATNG